MYMAAKKVMCLSFGCDLNHLLNILFCNYVCKIKFVYVGCYLLFKVLATTCTGFCKEIK